MQMHVEKVAPRSRIRIGSLWIVKPGVRLAASSVAVVTAEVATVAAATVGVAAVPVDLAEDKAPYSTAARHMAQSHPLVAPLFRCR